MYISKLHLQGFKSFLNKTDLEFGEGITTIIGPNGCGKSNIVDAIRWILGEQKISVLRSTKMEDVIFKGAKNYKPLGFCEVSLTINNNLGRLPTEYSHVEITRRYFRSGESEYLLNKVPCRLKDITGLFMDSGLSAHAYSVIELKMIDSIISQNPDERKKLFEEAAGINYYKQQRLSTLRKLEATRIDLDRVRDIILEVEGNVKNLNLQMKRFERHKKLSEKLKSSEVLLAQAEIQLLDMEANPLVQKFSERKSQQSALSGQVNLDEELISQIENKYNSSKKELDTINKSIQEKEARLNQVNNDLLVWTEQKKAGELRIQQYMDEDLQTSTRIETLLGQQKSLKINIADLQPKIVEQQSEFDKKNQENQDIFQELSQVESDFNTLRKQHDVQLNQRHEYESRVHKIKAKIEEKQNSVEQLQDGKTRLTERNGAMQFDIEALNTNLRNLEKSISDKTLEIEKLQKDQASLEEGLILDKEKLYKLKTELSTTRSRLQFYENIVASHEGKTSGAKYILSNPEKFNGIIGVVSDLLAVKEPYQHAVETGLGESIQYLIVDTRKHALENLVILKQESAVKISMIALDDVMKREKSVNLDIKSGVPAVSAIEVDQKYLPLFSFLIGDLVIVKSTQHIREISENQLNQFNHVTEDGDYFSKSRIIKSTHRNKESLIGRQKLIDSLSREIIQLESQIKKISNRLTDSQKSADALVITLKEKTVLRDGEVKKLNVIDRELSSLKLTIQHNTERNVEIDSQILENSVLIESLSQDQRRMSDSLEEMKKNQKDLLQKSSEAQVRLEKLRKLRNEKQQDAQDSRVMLVEIEKESEGYQFRLKSTNQQMEELRLRQDKIKAEREALESSVKDLSELILKNEKNKSTFIEERNLLIDDRISIEEKYNALYEELQKLQRSARDRQKVKEENILQIKHVELKLAEINKEKDLIKHRIMDVYRSEVPTRVLNLSEININELRDSIGTIDRSLTKIGPINMAVAEEYKAESERYEFLMEQNQDLVDSETKLLESIKKIDNEARTKFSTTFEQIAKHFKKTYAMFFEGGEAHVRLVGNEDPLESEIEIIARPPGKKTQTIRMLSAGEKAMTAIALLFAIYLVKPSPFCILDEVDAPLDDRNIGKFNNVIRKFSENTQFIVVTHNKLTMEEADYLYGVTQQEEGVSKIVSVNFKDISIPA